MAGIRRNDPGSRRMVVVSPGAEAISSHEPEAGRTISPVSGSSPAADSMAPAVAERVPDLFALACQPGNASAPHAKAGRGRGRPVSDDKPKLQMAVVAQRQPERTAAIPARSVVTPLPATGSAKKTGAVGAALAKPGMALMMRMADGEENVTPFRSLDDLLSAVKPILRAAARSPDAVWFSIQPVDLASLDSDAA